MQSAQQKASLVPSNEEQFGVVCYVPEQRIMKSRLWNSQDKASVRGSPAIMDDVLSVEMSISQAPPSFRQPVTQKKACSPPFKIRIAACFGSGCSQLPVRVNAYSLTADSLASFLKQASHNQFPAMPADSGLANASICKCLEKQNSDSREPYSIVHETFEFVDMHFKTSSRMALRWLLFVTRVRDDVLCVVYKHPTIVLSRRTDQYSKACCILSSSRPVLEINEQSSTTSSPNRPQTSSSCNKDVAGSPQRSALPVDVKEWIVAAYNECHFTRGLTANELGCLLFKLGIRGLTTKPLAEPWTLSDAEEDRQRFNAFTMWYSACLVSLKRERQLWCSGDFTRICPLTVDRTMSEHYLEREAIGTFLIRISSEPGSFVLSVKEISCHGEYIEHVLIDALDLKRRNLSAWIMENQSAQQFLDVRSGVTFPKHFIFIESLTCSPYHLINNTSYDYNTPTTRNAFPSLFDSATDSDGSSSHLHMHKYAC